MKKATISELKNGLSAYLRRVRAGEKVLILDRDRVVARLEPVRDTDDERLNRLQAAGLVRLPEHAIPAELLSEPPPRIDGVLGALLANRAEDR